MGLLVNMSSLMPQQAIIQDVLLPKGSKDLRNEYLAHTIFINSHIESQSP